jgi:hypothetical protein
MWQHGLHEVCNLQLPHLLLLLLLPGTVRVRATLSE